MLSSWLVSGVSDSMRNADERAALCMLPDADEHSKPGSAQQIPCRGIAKHLPGMPGMLMFEAPLWFCPRLNCPHPCTCNALLR